MRSNCESKDCITEAKRCNCKYEGAKADLRMDSLFALEFVVSADDAETLDVAAVLDLRLILYL